MAPQSPPRIRGGRAASHTCIITTNGDGAAADSVSQSVLQMKVQLLFRSTGHSRREASARTADFRRWYEAGNKRIRWKSSPQSPQINHTYFEVHSQRGPGLHSPGDFRNTCFFVGCCTDRAERCAEHNMSLVSVDRKCREESGNMEANISDFSPSEFLVFLFWYLAHFREKSKKILMATAL